MSISSMLVSAGCVAALLVARPFVSPTSPAPQHSTEERPPLATLYAADPIGHSMSFVTGLPGGIIQDHMLKNGGSDMDFGNYNEGCFTVGIEGSNEGWIVDLGSAEELQERYGFKETVGGGQGFASIRRQNGDWIILDDYDTQTTQPLQEAEGLFAQDRGVNRATVAEGHIYLVRIRNPHRRSTDRFVKFVVVEYVENRKVTLRWMPLS